MNVEKHDTNMRHVVYREVLRFEGCPGIYGIDKFEGERWHEAWCQYGGTKRSILINTDQREKALDTIHHHARTWRDNAKETYDHVMYDR